MGHKIRATYTGSGFLPKVPFNMPENAELEMMIRNLPERCTDTLDTEARKQILHSLLSRMRQTSLVAQSRRLVSES